MFSESSPCRWQAAALLFNLFIVLFTVATAPALAAEPARHPAHYIVFELDSAGLVVPLFHRAVELAEKPHSQSEDQVYRSRGRRGPRETPVLARLWNDDGDLVHQELVWLADQIQAEFPALDRPQQLIRHTLPMRRQSFVLRLPAIISGSLVIEHGSEVQEFSLSETLSASRQSSLASARPRPIRIDSVAKRGNPANRVDILIMGDGYTAAEQAAFDADADAFSDALLGISPYEEYGSFINLVKLFTPSPESGADHPTYDPACSANSGGTCCSDSAASTDPLAGTFVNTAYDARYCVSNIHRLMVVNRVKVLADASAAPNWDQIMVLVNDPTFGGSGGAIPTVSTNRLAADIARHEYGHSFTGLADEYDLSFPGFRPCSDLAGSPRLPCEPNVTDQTHRNLIKWAPWIEASTPIPTPENSGFFNEVGLFEGARYLIGGMHRPKDRQCLMNALGTPFCEVCAQEYVLKLYRGGWGVPATGIDLIEPGSEDPPPGRVAVAGGSGTVRFSVDLVQPVAGVDIEWKVDGITQPGETGARFVFSPSPGARSNIELVVRDPTPLVHPAMDPGAVLVASRRWIYSPSGGPEISIDFLKRNFGDVETGTSAPLRKVTLTNNGTRPLRIVAIQLRGADRSQFALPAKEDGCSEKRLAPGKACRFRVGFEPSTPGPRKALAVIKTNDPGASEIRVQLRGAGVSAVP